MTELFPFFLPHTLSFYLVIYVATLILHVVFMAYVLAGTSYIAWTTVFPGSVSRPERPLAKILCEWMPFVLSAAITAGVAPLLFVQIIYRQEFYTANLLLGWRWLIVIPALTIAFYLLYVFKSKAVAQWSFAARCAVAVCVASCFIFVAFCWTTNHLLQIDKSRWPEIYEQGAVVGAAIPLAMRLLTWFAGAFPVLSLFAGWQLLYYRGVSEWDEQQCNQEVPTLARLSLVGLGISVITALTYVATLSAGVQLAATSLSGLVWGGCAAIGVVLQAVGWIGQSRDGRFCRYRLALASVGGILMLTGAAMIREMIRIAHVDLVGVIAKISEAEDVGGFLLFCICAVGNVLLMGWCIRMTQTRHTKTNVAPS